MSAIPKVTDPNSVTSLRPARGPSALQRRSPGTGGSSALRPGPLQVSLLTGGGDKPYAIGAATSLTSEQIAVDLIGSDDLAVPELLGNRRLNFLNLRGDQCPEASLVVKMIRVLRYYAKLISYATTAKPKVFHILWNNKFELFDRTLLMLYYKLLGKKVVFTAHNVNAGKRDLHDSWLNRVSLKIQYGLCDHILVHTHSMKSELVADFRIPKEKVSVIPFGINDTVPNTDLSPEQAKRELGANKGDKVMLFFGNIAPYKGLEYLVAAFTELLKNDQAYRLLIVGRPKGCKTYWQQIQKNIARHGASERTIQRIEYILDEETELYFKAADVLILPYTRVFQSGVLLLGYSFGLPVLAADVGCLKEDVIEGRTGFVFKPQDSSDLAKTLVRYFESDLFRNLESRRPQIRKYAKEQYSWSTVAAVTKAVYANLLSCT
jgi:glycosyltransferase involved in cell wall biosynthesis